MRVLLAFIALACVDARWGTGGGKGAAKRKIEARDQVLLEEIRATHEDITENEMLERLAEMLVPGIAAPRPDAAELTCAAASPPDS